MDFGVVQPASRAGAWQVEGFGYSANARICLQKFEEKRERLNEALDRQVDARKEGRPYKFPDGLSDEYRLFRTATVMFAAMAVEAFLNLYGVKRLGEKLYHETFERLTPIHSKSRP